MTLKAGLLFAVTVLNSTDKRYIMSDKNATTHLLLQIIRAGWEKGQILLQQRIPTSGNHAQVVDIVLLHEYYPVAIVEVKPNSSASEGVQQAKRYAELMGIPLAISTNTKRFVVSTIKSSKLYKRDVFPSPEELWKVLGREYSSSDPRLFPALKALPNLRLPQALAIGHVLDALLAGTKYGLIVLPQGSGKTLIITQITYKLLGSKQYKKVLYLDEHPESLRAFFPQLKDELNELLILPEPADPSCLEIPESLDKYQVYITTPNLSLDYQGKPLLNKLRDICDLCIYIEVPEKAKKAPFPITLRKTQIPTLVFSSDAVLAAKDKSIKVIFELIHPQIADIDLSPPEGFKAVPLSDISDLSTGALRPRHPFKVSEDKSDLKPDQAYLLNGRSLSEDGSIDFKFCNKIEELSEISEEFKEKFQVFPGDILLPRIFPPSRLRIAVVPENLSDPTFYSDSLIRIRINQEEVSVLDVYNFLKSDTGQLLLQRGSSSTAGMPRLSLKQLGEMPIFLSEDSSQDVDSNLDNVSIAINQLQEVLNSLQTLDNESSYKNKNIQELGEVAQRLRRLAGILVPSPLPERVMNDYPTPIALAYRRFHDSRFNVYEQVNRLRDLYEATCFFCYNLLLSDFLNNLDQALFFVEDKGIRKAYQTFSMSRKIDFIKSISELARKNTVSNLYMPELVQSSFITYAEELKDLRNSLSHTATFTESKQSKILKDNLPIVEELLAELDFLRSYSMIRIPFFYPKNNQFRRRTEVFKGAIANLEDEALEDDFILEQLKAADNDHLMLYNSSGQILNLYPFYQLIDDERTNYETHICFFKQAKMKEGILDGESIQGSYQMDLDGYKDLENLVSRILDEKPES